MRQTPMTTEPNAVHREARFWDRVARKYARDPIKDMVGYERTLERTRALLMPSAQVFEIGCGTGTTALKLAPSVAHFIATDVSGEMIAIAREKCAAADVSNVSFTVAPHHGLPAGNSTCDAVLALNVLHLLDGRAAAYDEARRILKPGGLFISKTPCLMEMSRLIRLAIPVARMIGKAPHVEAFTAETLERELLAAGFAIVERGRHGSIRQDFRHFLVARVS